MSALDSRDQSVQIRPKPKEMAVPDLSRSQSEGDGVDLREGSEEGVEIVKVLALNDLRQKAETGLRYESYQLRSVNTDCINTCFCRLVSLEK